MRRIRPDRQLPWSYRFVASLLRMLMQPLTRRDWRGAEHLPRGRGFVVSPNHLSYVDPIAFAHFLYDNGHPPFFLAKESVFRVPVLGRMLTHAEQIPVYRRSTQAAEAFRSAVDAVREGKCVPIFPEGTLTRDPDLWPMTGKTGAARVALTTGCPLIPVAQWGPQEILAPRPQRDVVAGVREHDRERRTPRPGTKDRDLAHRLLLRDFFAYGLPISRTPWTFGSNRSAGACSPRTSSSSRVMSSMIRSVAWRSIAGVSGRPRRSSRSTGGPAFMEIVLRGNSRGRFAYGARMWFAPHCAIGMTGTPEASAMRAAPVLPVIGHRSGSRVMVPSG